MGKKHSYYTGKDSRGAGGGENEADSLVTKGVGRRIVKREKRNIRKTDAQTEGGGRKGFSEMRPRIWGVSAYRRTGAKR